MIHHTGQSVTG